MLYRIEFVDQLRVEGLDVDCLRDDAEGVLTINLTSSFSPLELVLLALNDAKNLPLKQAFSRAAVV